MAGERWLLWSKVKEKKQKMGKAWLLARYREGGNQGGKGRDSHDDQRQRKKRWKVGRGLITGQRLKRSD